MSAADQSQECPKKSLPAAASKASASSRSLPSHNDDGKVKATISNDSETKRISNDVNGNSVVRSSSSSSIYDNFGSIGMSSCSSTSSGSISQEPRNSEPKEPRPTQSRRRVSDLSDTQSRPTTLRRRGSSPPLPTTFLHLGPTSTPPPRAFSSRGHTMNVSHDAAPWSREDRGEEDKWWTTSQEKSCHDAKSLSKSIDLPAKRSAGTAMDADEGGEVHDASESTNRLSASFSFPSDKVSSSALANATRVSLQVSKTSSDANPFGTSQSKLIKTASAGPFRSTNVNPFSATNANFSNSANANPFSTANVNPSKPAKINPFSTANANLQAPGIGVNAGARPPWATTSKGCDSSGNSASSANPFASANAGKKNPFATEAAGGSVVRSSQFNMFVVDNPILPLNSGDANIWQTPMRLEVDSPKTTCRRRLKRLKSLELPMADARQLVAALVAPRTNSRRFGVHRDADLALCPFGVCAVQGPRVHMEDRYCVVGSLLQDPYASFFGVFDGHGGSNVADFCAANLFNNVADQLKTRGLQEAAGCLEDAFLQTDDQVRNTPQQLAGRDPLVGSTAVAMIITSTDCYIANVGDSRAVLVSHGRSEPTELTEDHKPNNPEERRRILEAGGTLSEDNRVEGILSMSRAIGDRALKKYVISRPQVIHRKLVSEDKAVILGTDGLWDFINCVNASNIVKLAESPQQAADKLVAAAMNGRSNDNTTALVVDLDAMRDAADLRVQQARRHAEATAAKASDAAAAAAEEEEEEEEEVVLALPSQRAKKGQQRGRKKLTIDV